MDNNGGSSVNASFFSDSFSLPLSQQQVEFRKYRSGDPKTFWFNDLEIKDTLRLVSTDHQSDCDYHFLNCKFLDDIYINDADCRSAFHFENCEVESVYIAGGQYKKNIRFENCTCNDFITEGGKFKSLEISLFEGGLVIRKGEFETLLIGDHRPGNCNLKNLVIECGEVSGDLQVYKSTILDLNISGDINENLKLTIQQCSVKHLYIWRLDNSGQLTIDSIYGRNPNVPDDLYPTAEDQQSVLVGAYSEKEEEKAKHHYTRAFITIENAKLGKANIDSVDFRTYDEVNVYKSSLIDIAISNVYWPRRVTTFYPHNSKFYGERFLKGFRLQQPDYLAKREIYRQLKYACSKQHDYIGEQHFHALEMISYDRALSWTEDFWTKLILKLSWITSNFGQSVIRPLIGIAVVNGFLFYLLYLTGDGPFKSYDLTKGENYVNTAAEFIRFANPLHKNEPELKGWAFIIDVLIRICSSYFIYNLIRATRRFVR